MTIQENNTNSNEKNDFVEIVDSISCEATPEVINSNVSIQDLREELNLEGEVSLAIKDETLPEEVNEDQAKDDTPKNDASLPDQEELSSLADEAMEAAVIEPASGEEDAQELALAKQLASVEPAAGDAGANGAASGGGYGYQSSFDAQGVIALNDVGPIDPTALVYGVENNNEEFFILEEALPNLNPIFELGEYQVYEDGSITVIAFAAPETEDGDITVVISGIPTGWSVTDEAFDALDASVGTGVFDAVAGTWTISLTNGAVFEGGPKFSPPADSDVDALNLTFKVSEVNPAGQSGSASGTFDIIVDAVADKPEIDAADDAGLEGETLDIDLSALTGEEVNNGAGSDDGSEDITVYEISGVPTGFILSAGVETAPGSGVYVLTSAEISGLQITPNDHNFSGSIGLTATVYTTETPVTDGEFDLTNNDNQDSDKFTLTWNAVADKPSLKVEDAFVKEDDSVFIPVSAQLADTDGSEYLTVTVEGVPASWTFSGAGWIQTGVDTYEIVLAPGVDYVDGFTLAPPADSDIDLPNIKVTAISTEVSNNDSASVSESIDIIVDAVADKPEIDAVNDAGLEGEALDVDITALTGEEVNNGAGSDDGSEDITAYEISGVPAGFTLSAGVETAPGSGVYVLTPAEIVGLQITPTDSNYFGSITLTATVLTTENPVTDGEFDLTDNNNQASDKFTLTWKPVINPPSVKVNQGVDDVLVKEDNSIDVPITAQLGANPAAGEYLTVTVTGIDASWGSFSAPIGTYNSVTGTWTVTLPAGDSLNTVFTFAPNGDSDIDLTGLVATAVATDPAAGISANATDDFNVIVDAVADAPDLDAGKACGEEGTVIPLTITTSVNDTDGSEVIEVVKISNLPVGATLTAGTYDAINDVWLLDVADLSGLGINIPDGVVGDFELSVESVAFEQNTNGIEGDLTDNRASTFDTIKICIKADDVPVVEDDEVTVDETNLAPTTAVNGSIVADFGSDNPGSIEGNGTFVIGSLTSGGVAVIVTFDAMTNTYTGNAGAETIFTLAIQSNGDYEFTLTGVVDHPDVTDHNDSLPLEFGVTAIDSEGDETDATITVNVLDDGPSITTQYSYVGEYKLENGPIVITKTLDFDFGKDGAGSVNPNGSYVVKHEPGGVDMSATLTSGGVLIDVITTANGYIGTAGGVTVFTVTVDALTGEYTYTQYETVDHPEGTIADDVLWIQFGVTVTDADGDTVEAFIGLDIYDDAPIAEDDCVEFNASEGFVDGNVVANDDLSQDQDNTVTQIKFGSDVFDVPVDGSDITINGANGALTIDSSGDYSYVPFADAFSSTYTFSTDNPPGSNGGGDIKNVTTSFNGDTNEFTFSLKVEDISEGFTVALNGGANPKGHEAEMALFYFDASGADPIVSVYAYNGMNTQTSWLDGSKAGGVQPADAILNSTANADLFSNISVTFDAAGNKIFSFTMDATTIQNYNPAYGPDGEWSGVSFEDAIGVWLHPVQGLGTSYDADGFLTSWATEGQGWYDTSYQDTTETHEECVQDIFEYVLTDGDGDSDSALLKIKTFEANEDLIVGQNVNDDTGSNVSHLVNGDDGVIDGAAGNDILVGDAGGSFIEQQTQDYNFVFIVDVSGSMGSASSTTSRISLLKDAVENLLNDFGNYQDGEIKIHITPFATGVNTTGTFTVTDAAGLVNALAYLETLTGSGWTNYESPLVEANDWLQSGEALDNAITTTYFISDGSPNRFVNDNGDIVSGSSTTVINEITGSDGSDEVALLHSLNDDVIAVGVDVSASLITRLSVIDFDGNAINIDDPSDLSVVFADTSPLDKLSSAGDDVIEGGSGNDIIFGDVLFTDDLADIYGLGTDDGAGWEVFERLENGESVIDPDWSRDETITYIRDHQEELAQESVNSKGSGRDGGDDVLSGGAGNDVIFGQEGNDIIAGGEGNDVLYGGTGADIFLFKAISEGVDTVKDFNAGEGDVVDLSALLAGYDELTQDISDFVVATEVGGNTVISIDQSGNAGASGVVEMAVLEGVTGFDLDTSIKTDTMVA